jgi:hypothetical protein
MRFVRPAYAVGVAGAALLLATAMAGSWLGARRMALAESARLAEATAGDIARVRALRTREDRAALEPEGDANLTRLVRSALIASRVGEGAFVSLGSEGTGSGPGSVGGSALGPAGAGRNGPATFLLRKTSVRLKGLRLEELGRFLARWREVQPVHVVTSIELTRAVPGTGSGSGSSQGRQGQPAGTLHQADERFDATLVLSAWVVARPGAAGKDGSA